MNFKDVGVAVTAVATIVVAFATYRTWQTTQDAASAAAARAASSTATFTDPPQLGNPRDCLSVRQSGLTVSGKATMRHGQELWLLVRPPGQPTFYVPETTHLTVSVTGDWSADTQNLGAKTDPSGSRFQLLLIAADLNDSTTLQAGNQKDGQVHSLGNMDVIQTACVTRN